MKMYAVKNYDSLSAISKFVGGCWIGHFNPQIYDGFYKYYNEEDGKKIKEQYPDDIVEVEDEGIVYKVFKSCVVEKLIYFCGKEKVYYCTDWEYIKKDPLMSRLGEFVEIAKPEFYRVLAMNKNAVRSNRAIEYIPVSEGWDSEELARCSNTYDAYRELVTEISRMIRSCIYRVSVAINENRELYDFAEI